MQKTYIGGKAEVAGSNPATGAYSYYATDNLGSPRAVYSQAKALVAELDYTPYGQAYTANDTLGITHRYTGHDWDAAAALYFAPYRFYNPQLARWTTRDPLGMVDGPSLYAYVSRNAVNNVDRLGLCQEGEGTDLPPEACDQERRNMEKTCADARDDILKCTACTLAVYLCYRRCGWKPSPWCFAACTAAAAGCLVICNAAVRKQGYCSDAIDRYRECLFNH